MVELVVVEDDVVVVVVVDVDVVVVGGIIVVVDVLVDVGRDVDHVALTPLPWPHPVSSTAAIETPRHNLFIRSSHRTFQQ